jgi:glycosyltransferase involved in cell wall biosynthesis
LSAPLFTVVIATRDRASLLETALRSISWQTCGDFECIVMDDGSQDSTRDVLKQFSSDPRFIWRRSEARGAAACRNAALSEAQGLFVTFLDDGDLWLPNYLEKLRDAARERPNVGFWFTNAYVWRFGRVIGRMFDPSRVLHEGKRSGYYALGDRGLPYAATTMAVARGAFERAGTFHEGISVLSDTDMVVRLLGAGIEAGVLPEPLAVRRLNDVPIARNHARIFEESAAILENEHVTEEMRESLRRDLALAAGEDMAENLQGKEMQAFLRRSRIEGDAAYGLLYAKGYLPPHVLALLYKARKLYLELRYQPRFAGKQFREIDALVATIL